MSLFDVADDLGAPYVRHVTRPVPIALTEADQERISALLQRQRPRIYPCQRCSQNVSVVSTDDPGRPYVSICDGCQLSPPLCTCERVPYAAP